MNKILLIVILLLSSLSLSFGQCLDCEGGDTQQITYTVPQTGCGTCTYTVYFRECPTLPGNFLLDSIAADNNNPSCCQGTATNDPIASSMILEEAADQIAQLEGSGITIVIYTPSKCWSWQGTLGPQGFHDAVLVPCDVIVESCCIWTYENTVLTSKQAIGEVDCYNVGCMPLCSD